MKKQTFLFVIDAFQIGGAAAFMQQHARAAFHMGMNVVIIGGQRDMDDPQGVFPYATIIKLPVVEGFGSLKGRLRWFFSTIRAIYGAYRAYDIVLFYSPLVRSFLCGLLHPKTWRIPRLYLFCGDIALESISERQSAETWKSRLGSLRRYGMQYIVVLTATAIMTISEYSTRLLKKRYPLANRARITIVPGGISRHMPSPIRLKKVLSILTVSRFEPRKGVDILLEAMALLRQKGIRFKLKLIGSFESPHAANILTLYERLRLFSDVQILHKASSDQIAGLLQEADLCVVPSRDYETFGMMTVTALSYGVPVIGTPTGATPEILAPIDTHLISRSADPQAISKAIGWFVGLSLTKRRALQSKVLRSVEARYATERVDKKVLQIFTKALHVR